LADIRKVLTVHKISAAKPPSYKENSTMTTEPTGLFQGLAPLLVNRTVIMTVAADDKGLVTLNVIPKKVKDDENDALTTPLCITASPEELDRDLAAQLREFTDMHAKAATNIQQLKDELAAAEKAEREAADERRAKKTKGKVIPPAGADMKPESVKPVGSGQTSLGLFDQADGEPEENSPASAGVAVEQGQGQVTAEANDYPD
jgi:PRTRC genetic system protein E